MGRNPCCSKEGLNRGAWTAVEDKILVSYVKTHGEGKWRSLPTRAGLKRCGKSCRLRWLNYLRPDIKRGNISEEEEELIIRLHKLLGNRWSLIAGRLPGRTDNEIKNYWNTTLCKKVEEASKSKSKEPVGLSAIRTKATKCSEAVLRPHNCDQPNSIQTKFEMDYSKEGDVGVDDGKHNVDIINGCGEVTPLDQPALMEMPLPTLADGDDVTLFDQAMLEDWLDPDYSGLQLDVGADLQSLVSFLDYDDCYWIQNGSGSSDNNASN